jgi:hypothetical protein
MENSLAYKKFRYLRKIMDNGQIRIINESLFLSMQKEMAA